MSRLLPVFGTLAVSSLAFGSLAFGSLAFAGDDDDREEDVEMLESLGYIGAPSPAKMMRAADLSATPGGAQDIGYFRDRVAAGEVPHPNVFTPEGLFSEHDLPLQGTATCADLLCPVAEATPARLLAAPDTRWLAQIGFDSGMSAADFRRAPLNLVAVIDKSGSMSGQPLETVKASLVEVLGHLGPQDQLSIVLYGDVVEARLPPTNAGDKAHIRAVINGIQSAGSTNMEAGLARAYAIAQQTAGRFDGTTRVMLFTDERPNVGRTDAASFMGMARDASQHGVGLTTVGVGVQFGAELATQISNVRGGNLFFFGDVPAMQARFEADFDTMVTELAHDFELRVKPAPGLTVTGVYGIPGELVTREADGTLKLTVETLFLSKDEGAIYFAFGPEDNRAPGVPLTARGPSPSLGSVAVRYTPRGKAPRELDLSLGLTSHPQLGLVRGLKLVDEYTVLTQATALHHEKNDQEGAYQLVHALAGSQAGDTDPELANERELVSKLESTLGLLSGHRGEAPALAGGRDRVTGLPR